MLSKGNNMNFTLVELTKIQLAPDEVLAVKLYGDDYDSETIGQLRDQLKAVFPNNRIMMFTLPNGTDIQMEAIKGSEVPDKTASCSTTNYCSDCSCGKKEAAEESDKAIDLIRDIEPSVLPEGHRLRRQQILKESSEG